MEKIEQLPILGSLLLPKFCRVITTYQVKHLIPVNHVENYKYLLNVMTLYFIDIRICRSLIHLCKIICLSYYL